MIEVRNITEYSLNFHSKKNKKQMEETHLLPNTPGAHLKRGSQKIMSPIIDYSVKGLLGDINSNFYEFLALGVIPYIAGSAMFMTVFNITKHLDAKGKKIASDFGRRMAMGVVLYGLLKTMSKPFVTKPVKWFTGVDTEMPYQNKVYNLPKKAGDSADLDIRWQQRKVFDSKEFYRKDLLEPEYFDKVGKKLGLGENLNDSMTEVSPIIQNIVSTSNLAKSLSSYCWAGVGVGLATQEAWSEFFTSIDNASKYKSAKNEAFTSKLLGKTKNFGKNFWNGNKNFFKAFFKSFKQMWNGKEYKTGFTKHAGKSFIILASAMTTLLTANTIIRAKNLAKNKNLKTIDEKKEITEI